MTDWNSESTKRSIRAGYYQKTRKSLDDKTLSGLTLHQKRQYKSYYEKTLRKDRLLSIFGYSVTAIAIFGFIAFASNQPEPSTTHKTPSSKASTTSAPDLSGSYYSEPEEEYKYTTEEEDCNPNYTDCVENSSYDLDCSDIGYEVEVTGDDEYNLDRDGDGYGCEAY